MPIPGKRVKCSRCGSMYVVPREWVGRRCQTCVSIEELIDKILEESKPDTYNEAGERETVHRSRASGIRENR